MECDRSMAGASRPRRSFRTQRRSATRHIPRREEERCGDPILRPQSTNERRQQRRYLPRRGLSHRLRRHAALELQQPLPALLAEPGGTQRVAGRADERYGDGVCEEGADGSGAGADRVHERSYRDAV